MNITKVFFRHVASGSLIGYGDITLDDSLVVKGLRLMNGRNGLFVSYPSTKDKNGDYHELVFPITPELRNEIQEAIITKAKATKGTSNSETTTRKTGRQSQVDSFLDDLDNSGNKNNNWI